VSDFLISRHAVPADGNIPLKWPEDACSSRRANVNFLQIGLIARPDRLAFAHAGQCQGMDGDRRTPTLELEEAAALAASDLPRQVSRALSVIRARKALFPHLSHDGAPASAGQLVRGDERSRTG